MSTPLESTITSAAQQPARAQTDMGSADAHPLPDLIQADQYLAGLTGVTGSNDNGGAKSGWGRLRTARAILPGTSQ